MQEKFKNFWIKNFEPEREPLCQETRILLKNCIVESVCFNKTGDFKRCIQDDIDPDCLSYRKQYSRCKRSSIDRSRDFRQESRYK